MRQRMGSTLTCESDIQASTDLPRRTGIAIVKRLYVEFHRSYPASPTSLFYVTSIAALLFFLVASIFPDYDTSAALHSVFAEIRAPTVRWLQVIGGGLLACAIALYLHDGIGLGYRWRTSIITAIVIGFCTPVSGKILETYVWTNGLSGISPPANANEELLSGSLFRQTFILLAALSVLATTLTEQPLRFYSALRTVPSRLILTFLGACFLLTLFLRMGSARYSILDLAATVAIATYTFWVIYYLIAAAVGRAHPHYYADVFAATCMFVPLFLLYSGNTAYCAAVGVFVFALFGLIQWFLPVRIRWGARNG